MNIISHPYIMANIAILLSYPLARAILRIPLLKNKLSQQQTLTFARFCLSITVIAFLFMPFITEWLSIQHSNLEFKPVIHRATLPFLSQAESLTQEQMPIETNTSSSPLKHFIFYTWLLGFMVIGYQLIASLHTLRKLKHSAFCQHRLKNVRILFANDISTPFCWSFFRHHFIALPSNLLENKKDLQLAIRHELQHIRQGDTRWLQILGLIHLFCFWNPLMRRWMNWLNELQEFACDEAIIVRQKTSPAHYAQCLINSARHTLQPNLSTHSVLAINGMSHSILYRRVNMLFSYKKQKRKLILIAAYCMSFCAITSAGYALNGSSSSAPLTEKEIRTIIKESDIDNRLQILARPEVVAEINEIRSNKDAKKTMLAALKRMKAYQTFIQDELKKNKMPNELLALPLIESGYRVLPENKNPMRAAGIWQIIPSTAKNLGLTVTAERDDRLNTELSTQAAIKFLRTLHTQFSNWNLAVLAYEIGENQTEELIHATGSRDVWKLAQAFKYETELKKYLAMFDAAVIIMHNPSLLTR